MQPTDLDFDPARDPAFDAALDAAFDTLAPRARTGCADAIDRLVIAVRTLQACALLGGVMDPGFGILEAEPARDGDTPRDASGYPFDTFQLVALCGTRGGALLSRPPRDR